MSGQPLGRPRRMGRPNWAPPEVDITRPSIARVYDYYLGGSHNFRADREAAQATLDAHPDIRLDYYAGRAFLRRAVQFLCAQGITQFLDIGSGIPTVGNVHQVAQRASAHARTVYVDIDPVAVAHCRAILAGDPRTIVVQADIRDAEGILADPAVLTLLDLSEPVGLLMLSVLHFIPDGDDPTGLLRRYRRALAPGSYLAITHGTTDSAPAGPAAPEARFTDWKAEYDRRVAQTRMRSKAEVAALFDGFDLVEPGLVRVARWRPDPDEPAARTTPAYSGVGRLR